MHCILSIFLLLTAFVVNADVVFPFGCKGVEINDKALVLSAPKPLLVMINNLSKTDIWITHPVTDPGASAGWSTRLQAGKWSALTLREKAFELSCIESKPGHEQQVSCESVLAICQWSDISMPSKIAGTYWAGEDMSLSALMTYIERRGFVLPAPSQ